MASSDLKQEKQNKSHLFTLAAIGAFILIVVWFTLQNADTVRFQFAIWGWNVSLALLLFTCVFIGILLACMAVLPAFLAERRYRKRAERTIRDLTAERDDWRNRHAALSASGASGGAGSAASS
jgi:uncharacterized integral membrane protein